MAYQHCYPLPLGGDPRYNFPQAQELNNNNSPMLGPTANGARGAHYTLIANVPYDTVRQDLVLEFRKFGRVELAMVVCDEASRHPHKEWTSTAGYAFVRFSKRSEAAAAIQAAAIGLISIRGTRVRADWARKDSYAKRGRVSPAQGAPLMGSMGMPDGIEKLQNSLLGAQWRQQNGGNETPSTAVSAANSGSYAGMRQEQPSVDRGQEVNSVLLSVLTQAFTKALTENSSPPCDSSSVDNHTTTTSNTPNNESLQPPQSPLRLELDNETRYDFLSDLARLAGMRFSSSELGEGDGGSSRRLFEDGLSPCSRGLLAGALTDVVDGAGSSRFCDLSPEECEQKSSAQQKATPEELLRKAVSSIPAQPESPAASRTTQADCRTACSSGSEIDDSVFSETSARRLDNDLRLPADSL